MPPPPPLSPRSAAASLLKGETSVAVLLKVDPPSLGAGGKLRGGDAGISKIIDALNTIELESGEITLRFEERLRPHHIQMLSEVRREGKQPLHVALLCSDNDVLSYDTAGRPPKWGALFSNEHLKITQLDIAGNSVEDSPPMHLFFEALSAQQSVSHITFRHLGSELESSQDKEAFFDGVLSVIDRLTHLNLTHCDLGVTPGEILIDGVAKREEMTTMEVLKLSWNGLRSGVPEMVLRFPSLRELHLGKNGIVGEDGFVDMLSALPKLEYLELNDNDLGEVGCCRVVSAISQCPRLAYLGLHENAAGDAINDELCTALFSHPALKAVDLSGNLMTKAGLASFRAAILNTKTSITEVNLSGNAFSGGEVVALDIAYNSGIKINYFQSFSEDFRKRFATFTHTSFLTEPSLARFGPIFLDTLYDDIEAVSTAGSSVAEAILQICARDRRIEAVLRKASLGSSEPSVVVTGYESALHEAFSEVKKVAKEETAECSFEVRPKSTIADILKVVKKTSCKEVLLHPSKDPLSTAQLCILTTECKKVAKLATTMRNGRAVLTAVVEVE